MIGVGNSSNVTQHVPRGAIRASAEIACVFVTCAVALVTIGCKPHRVDPGPDLQIASKSLHLRSSDPVPRTSPWFDGNSVSIVADGTLRDVALPGRAMVGSWTQTSGGKTVKGDFRINRQ